MLQSLAWAGFTEYIYTPNIVLNYKDAKLVKIDGKYYQDIEAMYYYPNAIALAAVTPVALYMDAGVKAYEEFYSSLLTKQIRPIAVAGILNKLLQGEKVSSQEISLLDVTLKFSMEFGNNPYSPYIEIGEDSRGNKSLSLRSITKDVDIIRKRESFYKYDLFHKDGINYFILFPKDNTQFLSMNEQIIPYSIFCDYNGAFYQFALDFKSRKAVPVMFEERTYQNNSKAKQAYKKLITIPTETIEKNFNQIIQAYVDYSKANR